MTLVNRPAFSSTIRAAQAAPFRLPSPTATAAAIFMLSPAQPFPVQGPETRAGERARPGTTSVAAHSSLMEREAAPRTVRQFSVRSAGTRASAKRRPPNPRTPNPPPAWAACASPDAGRPARRRARAGGARGLLDADTTPVGRRSRVCSRARSGRCTWPDRTCASFQAGTRRLKLERGRKHGVADVRRSRIDRVALALLTLPLAAARSKLISAAEGGNAHSGCSSPDSGSRSAMRGSSCDYQLRD